MTYVIATYNHIHVYILSMLDDLRIKTLKQRRWSL